MRPAVLRGREDVAVVDVPRPVPAAGEVLLRVEVALTCGTDAKVFRRGYHARMLTPPCLVGHEYAGVVEEVGAGVTTFVVGDDVVGANSAPCGACEWCARGREALCDDLVFLNGAFAEWLLVPERIVRRNLYHRPPELERAAAEAAATEPLACVMKGAEVAQVQAGDHVLLLGAGPIALLFAAELCVRGAHAVMFARRPGAGALAVRMGAEHFIVGDAVAATRAELLDVTPGGRGFDVVVEAAGAAETSEAAPTLCRKGGRVLLFGGCARDARISVDPARLHYDEVALLSSFHHTPRHIAEALRALASGRIDVRPLLSDPVGLDGVADALRRMNAREVRGKVPVVPRGGSA